MGRLLSVCVFCVSLALLIASPVTALTVEQQVTPEYLREHPKDFALKVEKREDGMLHFTLTRSLTKQKYFVSRTVLKQQGKKLADISTPSFGKRGENRFFISVAPARLAEAEYELSESFLAGPSSDPVPIPGTVIYKFNLKDFAAASAEKE